MSPEDREDDMPCRAKPNTYEAPGCQETDYPYQRFSCFFPLFSGAVVTGQCVLT
jgi:hypothetical protein